MRTFRTAVVGWVLVLSCTLANADPVAKSPGIRVGIYDSRAVALFKPDGKTLKMIADLRKGEPLSEVVR